MNDMKYLVKVSQFVNKTFALWVIIFGILGFIFPEIFKLVGPYVPVLLGVVMASRFRRLISVRWSAVRKKY